MLCHIGHTSTLSGHTHTQSSYTELMYVASTLSLNVFVIMLIYSVLSIQVHEVLF